MTMHDNLTTRLNITHLKNQWAVKNGYPSWDAFFDFVARDGEHPVVVAQQMEAAMRDVMIKAIEKAFVHGYEAKR